MLVSAASWVLTYLDIVEERYASLRGILGFNLSTLGLDLP